MSQGQVKLSYLQKAYDCILAMVFKGVNMTVLAFHQASSRCLTKIIIHYISIINGQDNLKFAWNFCAPQVSHGVHLNPISGVLMCHFSGNA